MCRLLLVSLGLAALVGTLPARALDLESSYETQRERDTGLPAQGFSLNLSHDFAEFYFASLSYSQLHTEPFTDGGADGREEYVATSLDVGAAHALSEQTEASLAVGYTQSKTRGLEGFAGDPETNTHGPSGSLTLSFRPHPWTELFLGPAYSYVGAEPAWQGNVGLSLKLLHSLWFTATYWGGPSKDGWSAGLRFGGN